MEELQVPPETMGEFKSKGWVECPRSYKPNTGVILRGYSGSGSLLGRYDARRGAVVALRKEPPFGKYRPEGKEQALAWDAFLNDEISCLVLSGPAGTGKTFMSVLFGCHFVRQGVYSKMLLTRSTDEVGETLGYLKGGMEEKLDPYLLGFFDNLEQIFPDRPDGQRARGRQQGPPARPEDMIEKCAVQFLRGRTLFGKFVIVDEAQNMDRHQIKTVVTRLSENSKLVVLGDTTQQDKAVAPNAVDYLREKFSGLDFVQFVEMSPERIFRGRLAKAGVDLL